MGWEGEFVGRFEKLCVSLENYSYGNFCSFPIRFSLSAEYIGSRSIAIPFTASKVHEVSERIAIAATHYIVYQPIKASTILYFASFTNKKLIYFSAYQIPEQTHL